METGTGDAGGTLEVAVVVVVVASRWYWVGVVVVVVGVAGTAAVVVVLAIAISDFPDHATFREKGASTALVRQTWVFLILDPM